MKWAYSSAGVRSLRAGLATSPRAAEVLQRCALSTIAALEDPMAVPWHDGSVVVDLTNAIDGVLGEAGVDEIFYQAVKCSLGRVLEPMLHVLFIIAGRNPDAMFGRLNRSLGVIMRGVKVTWELRSPGAGVFTVLHEDEVGASSFAAWGGSIRYTFDLVGTPGTMTPRRPSADNRTFIFDVGWKA